MIDLSLLASHQSLLLGGLSLCVFASAFLYIMRYAWWGYYVYDLNDQGKPTGTKTLLLKPGYERATLVPRLIAYLLGLYSLYALVHLGYNGIADPLTLILLFLGSACGMHLFRHNFRVAWIAAPLISGYGVLELWQVLAADPSWTVTLGSVAAMTLPTFLVLVYFEQAHTSLGEALTTTRLAVLIGALLMAQAVALWAGVSLWAVVLQGANNIILKLTPLLGGL